MSTAGGGEGGRCDDDDDNDNNDGEDKDHDRYHRRGVTATRDDGCPGWGCWRNTPMAFVTDKHTVIDPNRY
jgi:hypothetical protein